MSFEEAYYCVKPKVCIQVLHVDDCSFPFTLI
jgi:hypothetical protein